MSFSIDTWAKNTFFVITFRVYLGPDLEKRRWGVKEGHLIFHVQKTASRSANSPLYASLTFITIFLGEKWNVMVVVRFHKSGADFRATRPRNFLQKSLIPSDFHITKEICIAAYQSKAFNVLKTNFEVRELSTNSESSHWTIQCFAGQDVLRSTVRVNWAPGLSKYSQTPSNGWEKTTFDSDNFYVRKRTPKWECWNIKLHEARMSAFLMFCALLMA